jgi:hypothetical protein
MALDTDEAVEQLGPAQATYTAKPFNVATNMVSSIGCGTIGVIFTVWAIVLVARDESMCALPGSGAFFAFVVAYLAVYELRRERGFAVTIHENGLQHQLGGSKSVALWHDITGLVQDTTQHVMTADTVYALRLQRWDGSEIPIAFRARGITPNGKELAELLQNKIDQVVTPLMVAQFEAGATLSFGPFQLNQDSLTHDDKSIGWLDLEKAAIREGEIMIWQHEGRKVWARSKVALVPNIEAFVAILEQKLWLEVVDLVTVYRHRPRGRGGRG